MTRNTSGERMFVALLGLLTVVLLGSLLFRIHDLEQKIDLIIQQTITSPAAPPPIAAPSPPKRGIVR